MKVSAIMTPDPVTVSPDLDLEAAAQLMDEHGFRHLPVMEGGELVGILSDRDVLAGTGWLPTRVHACRGPSTVDEVPKIVAHVMHKQVVTTQPEADLLDAAVEVFGRRIGCLPVMSEGKLVGMLTETDLLRTLLLAKERGLGIADPPVADVMTTDAETIPWSMPLSEAIEHCQDNDLRHLPVGQGGNLVGIVSDRDLRRAVGVGRNEDTPVDEFMTRDVITTEPGVALSEAVEVLVSRKLGALPVVEDNRLVGILTITDILDHCLEAFRELEESA